MPDPIADLHRMIDQYGHAVLGVGFGMCVFCEAGDPEHEHKEADVQFSYTVGLSKDGLPELIMFAIDPRGGYRVLNHLAEIMRERGRPFDHMEQVDLGGRFAILAVKAEKPETWTEYVTWPKRLLGIEHCDVIQFVAADTDGRLPPGCKEPYSKAPLLTNDTIPDAQLPVRD